MVSSKDKRKYIEELLEESSNENSLIIQKNLYELLLKDSNGGKLYKYRSFDKDGFSLKNLQEGTIHCSNAGEFNDPFDCKIGITLESLLKAKYDMDFNILITILNKYVLVIQNELDIALCDTDEKRIINKLLSNTNINDYIIKLRDSNEKIGSLEQYIKNNPGLVIELLKTVLSDDLFVNTLGVCLEYLPPMVENLTLEEIKTIVDSEMDFKKYALAVGVSDDVDEVELVQLLCDKFYPKNKKGFENVQNLLEIMEKNLANSLRKMFLIGSLCTDYKNQLMWAHYSDSHKGFCIEYDYSNIDDEHLHNLPIPVIYSEERPLVPWRFKLEGTVEAIEEANKHLFFGILVKDKVWEYENEWRIIINADDEANQKMPPISCLYLGAVIEEANKNILIEIAKKHNIKVKQMKIARGTYNLYAEEIII